MKYTLIQQYSATDKITHEFTEESLDDVLRHIRYFLQGGSFVIRPGQELVITPATDWDKVLAPKKRGKK
jgi:hypothetical protein